MRPRFKEKWDYWVDNYMSKGASSLFFALLIIFLVGFLTLGIIRVAASFWIADDVENDLSIWRIFLQLTDPGNMAQDNDSPWYVKVFAITSGMFGIVLFSALIAFITTQLDSKLQQLKKGRSRVLENGHILVLGWNKEITEILRELIIANESERKASVVILADQPKEEMDDFLNEHLTERKTTKIITRTGQTGSIQALKRVAVTQSKSIIILPACGSGADENEKAHADAHTLKTTLAVVAVCQEHNTEPNIVVQVYNQSNRDIITTLSPDSITIVDPEDMVAKIAVQTSRSSGLAAVYTSLIGFEGCEFYVTHAKWNSLPFNKIQYHYPDGVVIGYRTIKGEIVINPAPDYTLMDSDDVIILAEDDSTIKFKAKPLVTPSELPYSDIKVAKEKEKALIIGWNNKGRTIIEEYTDYILPGSEIHISLAAKNEKAEQEINRIQNTHKDHIISLSYGNLFDINELSLLTPEKQNSIIILTSTEEDQDRADAATINILLLLREILKRKSNQTMANTQIIAEVLNSENLELISKTGVHDAIISTKMVSKVLSQIAEEPDILKVYDEIFKEEGAEIYIKPLSLYLSAVPDKITFADLIHAAQNRHEICLGYRLKKLETSVHKNFGIMLNPPKNKPFQLTDTDSLIVIAEDEL